MKYATRKIVLKSKRAKAATDAEAQPCTDTIEPGRAPRRYCELWRSRPVRTQSGKGHRCDRKRREPEIRPIPCAAINEGGMSAHVKMSCVRPEGIALLSTRLYPCQFSRLGAGLVLPAQPNSLRSYCVAGISQRQRHEVLKRAFSPRQRREITSPAFQRRELDPVA